MDAEDLEAIEKLAREATPGPWAVMEGGFSRCSPCPTVFRADDNLRYLAFCSDAYSDPPTPNLANARFIAALSPEVVVSLVEDSRRLARVVRILREYKPGVYPVTWTEVGLWQQDALAAGEGK